MMRDNKGKSVNNYVDNYCVIDLETTGVFVSSARIIELAAIKVRNGIIIDEFNSLVFPHCHIPAAATEVNHITDEMVKNAPELNSVIDAFLTFIGNDVIVGYNNAGFDMNILYDQLMILRGIPFSNNYIDVLHAARRCLSNVANYKLETICNHYCLDTTDEHRALKDCYLTKACYDNLFREYGSQMFSRSFSRSDCDYSRPRFSAETIALQNLQALLEQIIADGVITESEFIELKDWLEDHRDLQGNYPFDRVFNAIDRVLEDGVVLPEELEDLQILFSDFVDPIKSRSCHDEITSIAGKHVCVTGDFVSGERRDIFMLIEEAGGIIDKTVKKSTDYVVVGAYGSNNWKTGNYGSKIEKALQLNDKGAKIKIVEEMEFINAVKACIEAGVDAAPRDLNNYWQDSIRIMLKELIEKYELPKNSLYLSDNKGQKDPSLTISYSICIWEPNYPTTPEDKPMQNQLVLTITPSTAKSRPDDLDLSIREDQERELRKFLPKDAQILTQTKSDIATKSIRIRFKNDSDSLVGYTKENTKYCIEHYVSKEASFGCCGLFEKCSDAKKCIHENRLYSKACIYRNRLEQGFIYYGKNRNID